MERLIFKRKHGGQYKMMKVKLERKKEHVSWMQSSSTAAFGCCGVCYADNLCSFFLGSVAVIILYWLECVAKN